MDEVWLAREAARELAEETGVSASPEDLSLFAVTCTSGGNVGFFFRAPALPEKTIRDRFATLESVERAAGTLPEFDDVTAVGSIDDLIDLGGPYADSSILVVRRYLESVSQPR